MFRSSVTAIVLTVLLAASVASAKDPYNPAGDLLGTKTLKTTTWTPTKKGPALASITKSKVEFLILGSFDFVVVDGAGTVRDVYTPGYGGSSFSWENAAGLVYEIADYPYDNDHAPVSGVVLDGAKVVGTFVMFHNPYQAHDVAGRWSGEMAFPGGLSYPMSAQVADLPSTFSGCSHGAHHARLEWSGYPYQDTSVLHCADYFASGDHYIQTFLYDPDGTGVWFATFEGTVDFDATVFQGFVTAFSLYGDAPTLYGKFLLTRPAPFGK